MRIRGTRRILTTTMVLLVTLAAGAALAAGPVYWDWPAGRDFSELELDGTALNDRSQLIGGLTARPIGPDGSEVYWCLAFDGDGGFFTGAGHDGSIYHTDSAGESTLFARVGATEILSLLYLPKRGLYVGTGPEGKLFHLDSKGQVQLAGTVPNGYIWAMAEGSERGEIRLATGAPAALYGYDDDRGLELIAEFPATNTLDLLRTDDGDLYAATQGPGLLYRFEAGRKQAQLVFETPQDEARQLLRGPGGGTYLFSLRSPSAQEEAEAGAGMSGQGIPASPLMMLLNGDSEPKIPRAALWRVDPDGTVLPVWSGDEDLMIAAWDPHRGWLAGGPLDKERGRSRLLRLNPPAGSRPLAGWEGGDVLDILVTDSGKEPGRILVSQGHPHAVFALGDRDEGPRQALSPPLDGRRPVRWGRLRWTARGDSHGLKWSVRGGNRAQPDESWTEWSEDWTDGDRALELGPSRFLQWRVTFPDEDRDDDARVTAVSVSAWLDNSPPQIRRFVLENLQGLESGGLASRSENLTQTFRSGLKVEFDRQMNAREPVSTRGALASRAVRVFTWEGSDPDGDRMLYELQYRPQGQKGWRSVRPRSPETLGSWDTGEVPDGLYEMRLVVSDEPDNPGDQALESMRTLGPVEVDNTPPVVRDLKLTRTAEGLRVRCRVEDERSVLAAASLRMPDGQSRRLDPTDRICDSRREDFDAEIVWPPAGEEGGQEPWRIRLEVLDLNGNPATAEAEVSGSGR